jgi:hypothetical protein
MSVRGVGFPLDEQSIGSVFLAATAFSAPSVEFISWISFSFSDPSSDVVVRERNVY